MISKRLFIAVKLQEDELVGIQEIQKEWAKLLKLPASTAVPVENFHLTLHFLGKVESELWEPLIENLQKQSRLSSFFFDFNQALVFPRISDPRVLVMAGPTGNSPLSYLYSQMQLGLENLGFPTEKRLYVPHITLFRFKDEPLKLSQLPQVQLNLKIREYALYESRTDNARARYEVIKSWFLK